MKPSTRFIATPIALAFSLLSLPAMAQDTKPAMQGPPSTNATSTPSHAQKSQDVVEQRIKDLYAELKITDKQAPQWNAFAQTMRDNAQKTRTAFHDRAQKLSSMNANDAMSSYASLAQLHADNMKSLASSMRDLYSVLSDDQKAIADSAFRNENPKHASMHKHEANATKTAPATMPISK
ncbi:Spy/CpxP family protein refolding chaperone [Dyella sp. ASV21]|uniref:Spy/CpxP family protein refolding chaperone n=1 Tax=Dyella sp. ASV21 TaxID=2795114 RepID=UPI0018EDC873|nr:Spy/CpxP family protein refolding chaperone [Dyella sp. ASV21]